VANLARASRPDKVAKYTLDAALRAVMDSSDPVSDDGADDGDNNSAQGLVLKRDEQEEDALSALALQRRLELLGLALVDEATTLGRYAIATIRQGASKKEALVTTSVSVEALDSFTLSDDSASGASGVSGDDADDDAVRVLKKFPASIFLWSVKRAVSLGVDRMTPKLEALWPSMILALADLEADFAPTAATRRLCVLVEAFIHVHSRPSCTRSQAAPPISSPRRPRRSSGAHGVGLLEHLPRLRSFFVAHRTALLNLINGDPTLCEQLDGLVSAKKWLEGESNAALRRSSVDLDAHFPASSSPVRRLRTDRDDGSTSPRSPSSPEITGVDQPARRRPDAKVPAMSLTPHNGGFVVVDDCVGLKKRKRDDSVGDDDVILQC
jgi:hypothetical protein